MKVNLEFFRPQTFFFRQAVPSSVKSVVTGWYASILKRKPTTVDVIKWYNRIKTVGRDMAYKEFYNSAQAELKRKIEQEKIRLQEQERIRLLEVKEAERKEAEKKEQERKAKEKEERERIPRAIRKFLVELKGALVIGKA